MGQGQAVKKSTIWNARPATSSRMRWATTRSGTVDGDVVVTWKTQKRRALTQKALKEHQPEIVESYMETTEVRRFVVFE